MAEVGQVPLIVRSSSLLEDSFGTSFAGKYQSYFCPNQGSFRENFDDLLNAIKRIYASTLNPDAILYRQKHGLIDYDERMAILIQEVQGERFEHYYFPTLAGVGFSQNAYRWHEKIRREDGFVRLVWGMGTRAVDRMSSDYARLIGLSHAHLRPETTARSIRQYSQHYIDLIDLEKNSFKTLPITEVLNKKYPYLRQIASVDRGDFIQPLLSQATLKPNDELVLTFNGVTHDQGFVTLIRDSLQALEKSYDQPVDTEFTVAIDRQGLQVNYRLYILQCRPLSQRKEAQPVDIPQNISPGKLLFRSRRLVPDGTITDVRYLIFIDPQQYRQIQKSETKLELGRLVSRLNQKLDGESFVLIGPGRWGSTNIDLGVRVSYADIHNTRALIEIGVNDANHAPELSYGTHFFQDLVEAGIFALPLHLDEDGGYFNWSLFDDLENVLPSLMPDDQHLAPYLRVIDLDRRGQQLTILMNGQQDETVAFLSPAD